MFEDSKKKPATQPDEEFIDIRTTMNFISRSLAYYTERGIDDEESLNALKEILSECRRLDGILRKRWRPDALTEWEQIMTYVEEKEQQLRDLHALKSSLSSSLAQQEGEDTVREGASLLACSTTQIKFEDPKTHSATENDDSATEISTALNFITGSIEYYYQRGIADEETLNALNEAFAEFHRLDAIIRERARPDELVEWEELMTYIREKEQEVREIESNGEENLEDV